MESFEQSGQKRRSKLIGLQLAASFYRSLGYDESATFFTGDYYDVAKVLGMTNYQPPSDALAAPGYR